LWRGAQGESIAPRRAGCKGREKCLHFTPVSRDAQVNYYRCERCGHVWTLPKGETDVVATGITPTSGILGRQA